MKKMYIAPDISILDYEESDIVTESITTLFDNEEDFSEWIDE